MSDNKGQGVKSDAAIAVYSEVCSSIEANMDRRLTVNRFNFSLLAAVGAGVGLVFSSDVTIDPEFRGKLLTTAALVCVVISVGWVFQILRFREVARVKHLVAEEIEQHLGVDRTKLEMKHFAKSPFRIEHTLSELFFPLSILAIVIWFVFG